MYFVKEIANQSFEGLAYFLLVVYGKMLRRETYKGRTVKREVTKN